MPVNYSTYSRQFVILHQIRLARVSSSAVQRDFVRLQSKNLTGASQRWFRTELTNLGFLGYPSNATVVRHVSDSGTPGVLTDSPVWARATNPRSRDRIDWHPTRAPVPTRHTLTSTTYPEVWLRRKASTLTLSRGPMARKKRSRQQYELFKHALIRRTVFVRVTRLSPRVR